MGRIVITGGTGLIGRALAPRLLEAGHEVVILSRRPGHVPPFPGRVNVVGWDGRTATGWGALADGATAIVNLAGETIGRPPWTAARKGRIYQSRVDAGRAVVEAVTAARQKPLVLIQASGIGYYGCANGDEVVTEQTPAGDDFLARVCVDWEAATAEVEAMDVRRVILRNGVVLSGEGGALPLFVLPFRYFAGGPTGNGRQFMPWIHIADEVAAIRLLIERPDARGAYNLTAPNPLTNADFSRAVGRALKRPSWLPMPAFALELMLGDFARLLLLGGQRAVPERLLALGYRFQFSEAEAALKDLL
ncbi:MAG: TIGR01777 family protein [Chloroflexi bacterium]|nr:TIGR01777 family protein [Chloroflexota bacterium]